MRIYITVSRHWALSIFAFLFLFLSTNTGYTTLAEDGTLYVASSAGILYGFLPLFRQYGWQSVRI